MGTTGKQVSKIAVALCLVAVPAFAAAQPGDDAAVARARKAYAEAMKGDNLGLQNARRTELKYQLSLARKRHQHKAKPPRHTAQAVQPAEAEMGEKHASEGHKKKD